MTPKTPPYIGTVLPARTAPHQVIPPLSAPFEPGFEAEDLPGGPNWSRLGNAIRRYKWLVLATTLCATGIGIVASRFLKPTYTAQATIWIDESDRRGATTGALGPSQVFGPEAWSNLLRSYAVLEGVVQEVHLNRTITPPLPPSDAAAIEIAPDVQPGEYHLHIDDSGRTYALSLGDRVERGAVGDSIGRSFGFRWMPSAEVVQPARSITIAVTTVRDAAKQLGDALQPHIDEQGNFLHVELSDADPVRLAATLNAVARHYVAVAADLKRKKVVELTAILADQATLATKSLSTAEQDLQGFRTRTALLPSDAIADRGAVQPGGYDDLTTRLDATQSTRAELERIVATPIDSTFAVGDLEAIAISERATELSLALADLTAKRTEIHTLRYKYADENPLLVRALEQRAMLTQETIPQLAKHVLLQLRNREAALESHVATAAVALKQLPQRDLEETRLRRNVTLADNLYSALEQRYDEAQIAKASSVSDVRILDVAAPPQKPSKNAAVRIILLVAFGGLALGLAWAVLLDRSDKRFRYPDQVSHDLGLTILGALPHLRLERDAITRPRDHGAFNEAMRDLRLNVAYAFGSSGPVTFAITSPGSEDGKSFVASTLARVFAENGRRTVLVDGDLRRGQLHRRFSIERQPGMADYLGGTAQIDQILRGTMIPGLDIITSGARRSNAPELLGTQQMLRLMDELRARYDVVICDSPPLAAGIDAAVLGAASGHLLLVVRTGVSVREVAAAKLETVARLPIRVLGAVLNDVPKGAVYSYYAHYALPGYEASDERAVTRVAETAGRA
jgi:capsular exopolysaccharide synthesis family protein